MTWNLFIDDERFPPDDGREWIICRNKMQVIAAISDHGGVAPSFISFDHDLGENEPTGYDILVWMIDKELSKIITIPDDLDFYVHSQNPIGKTNIEGLLNNYMKAKRETTQ